MPERNAIIQGDALTVLRSLPAGLVQCVVTSPPYWALRDYGVEGQIGREKTPEEHIERLVEIFREVRRVMRDDAILWLNYGDCYTSSSTRSNDGYGAMQARRHNQAEPVIVEGLCDGQLVGMPWRVAFALQADGWVLRSDVIWFKPNPMPENASSRPAKAHEYIFLLTKSTRYFYDADAIKEPARARRQNRFTSTAEQPSGDARKLAGGQNPRCQGGDGKPRNRRSVWTCATSSTRENHFATFPPRLIRPCIRAGIPDKGSCSACGKPWQRNKSTGGNTIGFRPDCLCGPLCGEPTRPAIVLDPFIGSGTVAQVAIEEGGDYLGIELNPEYIDLAKRRIARVDHTGRLDFNTYREYD